MCVVYFSYIIYDCWFNVIGVDVCDVNFLMLVWYFVEGISVEKLLLYIFLFVFYCCLFIEEKKFDLINLKLDLCLYYFVFFVYWYWCRLFSIFGNIYV